MVTYKCEVNTILLGREMDEDEGKDLQQNAVDSNEGIPPLANNYQRSRILKEPWVTPPKVSAPRSEQDELRRRQGLQVGLIKARLAFQHNCLTPHPKESIPDGVPYPLLSQKGGAGGGRLPSKNIG